MFTTYNYSASATLGNIIKDIADILTGTTDKTQLSAGCDQANTTILYDIAVAGWTMHDRAANSAGTCTFTNATNRLNKTAHGLADGEPVNLTNSGGGVPPELAVNTDYYVLNATANDMQLAATPGGAAIDFSTDGTGTTTLWTGRKQMFKAACADSASLYKYALLTYINAGYIQLNMLDGWTITASSKTASNATTLPPTTGADAGAQRTAIGTGGTLLIFASARRVGMQSSVTAGIGAVTTNAWMGIFERSREAPWDTVANGYLPAVASTGYWFSQASGGTGSMECKYKNPAGGDYVASSAASVVQATLPGWVSGGGIALMSSLSGVQKLKAPDGLGGFFCPFNEIKFSYATYAFQGGSASDISDVWVPPAYVQNLDKTTYNGKTYVFLQNTGAPATTGCLAVPRG